MRCAVHHLKNRFHFGQSTRSRVVLCRPSESRVRDVPWQTPPEALDQPLIVIIYHNHLNIFESFVSSS